MRLYGGSRCRFGLLRWFWLRILTLIRHAMYVPATGAISAATLCMHLPPAFARLVSATGLPLPAAPHLQSAVVPTVHLAAIASAADQKLLAATEAKKHP